MDTDNLRINVGRTDWVAGGPREDLDSPELRAEKIRMLYQQGSHTLLASPIAASTLAVLFWDQISNRFLLIWLATLFLTVAIRAAAVFAYRRKVVSVEQAPQWGRLFLMITFAAGWVWGIGLLVLFPRDFSPTAMPQQAMIMLFAGGLLLTATLSYSAKLSAFLTFTLPFVGPLLVVLVGPGPAHQHLLGTVALLFVVIVVLYTVGLSRSLEESLKLRFQNADLIEVLTRANDRAEQLVEELRLSEAIHRSFIENLGDGVVIVQDGIVRYANPALLKIVGYTVAEMIDHDIRTFLAPQDQLRVVSYHLRRMAGAPAPDEYETGFQRRNGQYITARMHESIITWNGRPASLATVTDITARKAAEDRLAYLAHHDSLTHLPNRELFFDRLRLALAQARRANGLLALLYVDLDGFKAVNDTLGHEAGDRLLCAVAGRLRVLLRESDTLARIGGDEFTVILSNLEDKESAQLVAEKILAALVIPVDVGDAHAKIGASIGVAMFPLDGLEEDTLIARADQAMYRVKQSGKCGVAFATDRDKKNPAEQEI